MKTRNVMIGAAVAFLFAASANAGGLLGGVGGGLGGGITRSPSGLDGALDGNLAGHAQFDRDSLDPVRNTADRTKSAAGDKVDTVKSRAAQTADTAKDNAGAVKNDAGAVKDRAHDSASSESRNLNVAGTANGAVSGSLTREAATQATTPSAPSQPASSSQSSPAPAGVQTRHLNAMGNANASGNVQRTDSGVSADPTASFGADASSHRE